MFDGLPTQRVIPALKFLAVEAHISQEKLASKVGMSSSAVGRRLAGDTPISLSDLEALATALGVEVHYSFVPKSAERAA